MLSTNGTVKFEYGEQDRSKKRRLTVRHGDEVIVDELNPFSAYERQGILTRAANQFDLDEAGLKAFEDSLLAAADRASKPTEVICYPTLSGPEIADFDAEEEYFIADVLARNHYTLAIAPNKTLKTSVMLDLAISVASGTPFLDQFKIEHSAPCGIMSGESGMPAITKKMRRIAHHKGISLRDLRSRINLTGQIPKFNDLRHMDAIEKWITDRELELLIIDPVYLCVAGSNAADVAEQGEMLRSIGDVCTRCGCTLLLVHHLRKHTTYNYDVPELTDVAGAGYAEWAGQWLILGRREKFDYSGVHRLWFVVGGRAEHWGQWGLDIDEGQYPDKKWEPTIMEVDELEQTQAERKEEATESKRQREYDAKVEKARGKIHLAFKELRRQTQNKIRQHTKYRSGNDVFADAWDQLFENGRIVESGEIKQKNGHLHIAYEYREPTTGATPTDDWTT